MDQDNAQSTGTAEQGPESSVEKSASPSDVAVEASPEGVINQLHRRRGGRNEVKDERTAERSSWVVKLGIKIVDPSGDTRDFEVTTHDLSPGGFSFVFNQFLHPGTLVLTFIESLPNKPKLLCVVRNCVHTKGSAHRVGVQFERTSNNIRK